MILELQTAQGQWAEGQNDNQWVVVNRDNEEIARLPATLGDYDAMQVIRFGRKFEMKAFEDGVAEGLRRGEAASQVKRMQDKAEIDRLMAIIGNLEQSNITLAHALNEMQLEGTE